MAQKPKTRTSNKVFAKARQNKFLIATLIIVFLIAGVIIVYSSFASGTPVFHDNVDYWRPRIGQCESGNFYQNKKNPTHFGAFQFDLGTWRGAVGPDLAAQYPNPADAPPAIQDLAFNNTFARRGTQPWNASYNCWIKGATVPGSTEDQVTNVVNGAALAPTTPPAKPFWITSGSYNVVVNGRVTLNDQPLPNVILNSTIGPNNTCTAERQTNTDADGRFSVVIPVNTAFCLQPVSGVPAGAQLTRTSNNVEHATALSFEYQIAGEDCYKQFWCFLSPSFTWDRSRDSGYNFYYTKP
jgi:hypothetical protein